MWCCTGEPRHAAGKERGRSDGGKIVSRWSLRLSRIPRLRCLRQNSALCPVCTQHRLSSNLAGRAFFLCWNGDVEFCSSSWIDFPSGSSRGCVNSCASGGNGMRDSAPLQTHRGCWVLVIWGLSGLIHSTATAARQLCFFSVYLEIRSFRRTGAQPVLRQQEAFPRAGLFLATLSQLLITSLML